MIWLFSLREPKGRIARWLEILSPFDFTIEYRQGSKHANADAMSRCQHPRDCDCPVVDNLENLKCGPCKKCHKRAIDMESSLVKLSGYLGQGVHEQGQAPSENESETVPICAVKTRQQVEYHNIWTPWEGGYSRSELQKLQQDDPDHGPLFKWKESDQRPTNTEVQRNSAATRHYWHLWGSIEIKDGLLCKMFCRRDGTQEHYQFLVPIKLKEEVLRNLHNSVFSGHLGTKKTKGKLIQRYYWYEMREDVDIWIS